MTGNYHIENYSEGLDKITYTDVTIYDFKFNAKPDLVYIKTDTLELWDGLDDGYFSFIKK